MLENLFQELNKRHFGDALPIPKLVWNSRLRSSAGRFAPGSRNPLRPKTPEIEVASYLKELADAEFHIRDTLLHEMVHYFLWHQKKPYGHTPEFHQILKRAGARRYNPVPKLSPVKYWYECKTCQKKIPARRKIRLSACADCCNRWNRGYFSEKFLLVMSSAPETNGEKPGFKSGNEQHKTKIDEAPLPLPPQVLISRLESLKQMILRNKRGIQKENYEKSSPFSSMKTDES